MSSYNVPKSINGQVSSVFNADDYVTDTSLIASNYVNVTGNQMVGGNKTMQNLTTFTTGITNNGNTIIGDDATDTLTVYAQSTFNGTVDMRNAASTSYVPAKIVSGVSNSFIIGGANISGSNNVALGYNSGSAAISATNSMFLGNNCSAPGSGYTNSTCIGNASNMTASNQMTLGVSSTTTIVPNLAGTGNRALYVDSLGNLTMSTSDMRLKDEITGLDSLDSLNKVLQLKPSSWLWKKNGQKDYGLIAQQLQLILPELVYEISNYDNLEHDESGNEIPESVTNYLAINYHLLTPYLIGSIQALNTKINDQNITMQSILSVTANLLQRVTSLEPSLPNPTAASSI